MHFVMFFLMLITIVYAIVQAVTAVEVKFYFYYMYMIGKSETDKELISTPELPIITINNRYVLVPH